MIYIGDKRVADIYLGAVKLREVYLGAVRVFSSAPVTNVLFDNGFVSGVDWAGNILRRPNYTSSAIVSFDNVASGGYMEIRNTGGGSSSLQYNAHVCTSNPVVIPAAARRLCVDLSRSPNACYLKFGMLSDNYADAMSADGGFMSPLLSPSYGRATYSVDLPDGFAGSGIYRPVINLRVAGDKYAHLDIYKVYFE